MPKTTITTEVILENSLIDENIEENVKIKLNSTFLNRCFQEYGYILKIYKKIYILKNTVKTDGVVFLVKFEADTFKPSPDDTFKGTVCMVFQQGILVEIINKIKVLIPSNKLEFVTYNKVNNTFESKHNNTKEEETSLKKGSLVEVKIDVVKYEKQNFNCIGTLNLKKT